MGLVRTFSLLVLYISVASCWFKRRERTFACPVNWVVGPNENCYKFVYNPKANFNGAQAKCEEEGANLVSLDSIEEIYWMRGHRSLNFDQGEQDIWIGGKQSTGGRFYWMGSNGARSRIRLSDWSPNGEPNGGVGDFCITALNDRQDRPVAWHWKWNDNPCTQSKAYICEKANEQKCFLDPPTTATPTAAAFLRNSAVSVNKIPLGSVTAPENGTASATSSALVIASAPGNDTAPAMASELITSTKVLPSTTTQTVPTTRAPRRGSWWRG